MGRVCTSLLKLKNLSGKTVLEDLRKRVDELPPKAVKEGLAGGTACRGGAKGLWKGSERRETGTKCVQVML